MLDLAKGTAKVCPVTGTSVAADMADRTASEWVVLTAVRCRLAGYEFGDIACWELCSDILEEKLGAYGPLVEAELSRFVRKMRPLLKRPLDYHPHPSRAVSQGEAILLDLLANAGKDAARAREVAAHLAADADALLTLATGTAGRLAKAGIQLGG